MAQRSIAGVAAGFVHLHNHSEYSLLDGIARIQDIAKRLKELDYDSYALTDHGVMYGAMEFYLKMREAGIKPILGCEVYVAQRKLTDRDSDLDRKSWHCVLLASNEEGYINLMQLTSIAHRFGYYYKPRVDVESIKAHNAGLICLTACPNGIIAGPFHRNPEDDGNTGRRAQSSNIPGGPEVAREAIETYLRIFGPERMFLEIQNHGMDIESTYAQWARDEAARFGLRLVATNDNHYVGSGDATAHDICLCLRDKKLLTDKDRLRYSGPDYYIKSQDEMAALFADLPEALANTQAVANLCNLELDLNRVHFPQFEVPVAQGSGLAAGSEEVPLTLPNHEPYLEIPDAGLTTEQASQDAYLRKMTYEGAARRYGTVDQALKDRIEYELGVIIPKGFTTYFLICADFCGFARSQNIPVGPGRGSAAGSVVAYCLEITDLDPIKYGLYFERFLNPERIELPDADIDFCYRRREEVIEHVKRKYGADRVAMIVTYSRLKARAVIKAVGRTKGLEYQYVDRVTKEISGLSPTIDEAVSASPALQKMITQDSVIKELIDDARRLEGIAAHHSVHAAGIVIAPEEISKFVPVQPLKDSDLLVTQYAMDTVPKTGLVKFDFLGLRNLTMIQDCVEYIEEYTGEHIEPRTLPDDDPDVYAMLQRGDGYGVFQFEAPQVKRMLIDGKPASIEDLAAINAANRPGPLTSGNTERYLQNRKAGVAGTSLFPSVADVLQPTGGVLLFQEQVLEIARKLGGFSLGEADILRKAMGKKNFEAMQKQQEKFIAGAIGRKVPRQEIDAIWEMMLQFAGYGFNKAHAVCYAWIAYQTAWLKCHYPHYFMCAMLNSYVTHSTKLAEILAQCRRMRIPVLPPSVNDGRFDFTPTRDGSIVFGLGGIKGIGQAAVDAIVGERDARGNFSNLAEFSSRMKSQGVNKKVLQSLAMAGALDGLGASRADLIRNLDNIESFMRGPDRQVSMFGDFEAESTEPGVLASKEVTDFDIAMCEKQAIGLFITNHPFADHQMYSDRRHLQLAQLSEEVTISPHAWHDRPLPSSGLVGLLTDVQVRTANTSSKQYAKARLEDTERSVAVLIWPKAYEAGREAVSENSPAVLYGRVQIPDTSEEGEDAWDGIEIVVDRIEPYESRAQEHQSTVQTLQGVSSAAIESPSSPVLQVPSPLSQSVTQETPSTESGTLAAGAKPGSPPKIHWEVDLGIANKSSLARLAEMLASTQGNCELMMHLREVGGQLRNVRVPRKYFVNEEDAIQMTDKFDFLRRIDGE